MLDILKDFVSSRDVRLSYALLADASCRLVFWRYDLELFRQMEQEDCVLLE